MTENRKPKHVSFELGAPVTREEVEAAGIIPDDLIPVHFTSIGIDALATLRADLASEERWANEYHQQAEALEAENRRLRDDLLRANAANCEKERENQRLAAMWQAEHTERVKLEERLKMAEMKLQVYQEA